jgi:hypothetical protein
LDPCDTSDPLTFRFHATRGTSESKDWKVSFSILNQKLGTTVAGHDFIGCEAVPSLIDGSAIWGIGDDPGISKIDFSQGLQLYRSSTPVERLNGLSHCSDADNDGMNDSFERIHGLAPDNPSDALTDDDTDGLSNLLESILGTNPFKQIVITMVLVIPRKQPNSQIQIQLIQSRQFISRRILDTRT